MKPLYVLFSGIRFRVFLSFCLLLCTAVWGASDKYVQDRERLNAEPDDVPDSVDSIEHLRVRPRVFPQEIRTLLENNLNYFRDGVGVEPESGFPYGNIEVDRNTGEIISQRDYVKTTYISTYLTILLEMSKVGGEDAARAHERIRKILNKLFTLSGWEGLLHGGHYILKGFKNGTDTVSTANNSKLVFTLMAIIGAYKGSDNPVRQEITQLASDLLKRQAVGWSKFYDPVEGLMRKSWDTRLQKFKRHTTQFVEEAMPGVIAGILLTSNLGNAAIPETAFTRLVLDITDYPLTTGEEIVSLQSGSGALYYPLVPMLWLDQERFTGNAFRYFTNFVRAHNDFRKVHNLPFMLSACTGIHGGYYNFGVPALALKKENTPYDAATPRTIGLAYMVDPDVAIEMAVEARKHFPNIETPYGWYDSMNAAGETTSTIKTLGQGLLIGGFLAKETHKDLKKYFDDKEYTKIMNRLYKNYKKL